jgi:glutathione S-transferase
MTPIKIYSMAVCPFAQRTRMLLKLKRIPFEVHEIDISKPRPDWFLRINPKGQVPVIEHEGRVLNESTIINEYLEEVFPEPPLMPRDPYRRALMRLLIAYGNETFIPLLYRLLMNQDATKAEALAAKALASWRWLDEFLAKHNPSGTYLWEEFGMADLSFAPFFQRYVLNAYYRGFAVPESDEYKRVCRWRDALLAHPAAIETRLPDEDYIKLYEDYSLGLGNGAVPPGRARSSFDLSVPLASRPMPPRVHRTEPTAAR